MLPRIISIPFILGLLLALSPSQVNAQCIAGYTSAQLNWDNLDYYYNSGNNVAPYGFSSPSNGCYVTNTMEQNQKFAIGTTYATFVTSNAAMINPGTGVSAENGTHTGNLANYTGDDVQYNPNSNGQNLKITFASPVSVPNFVLYDIDGSAVVTVTATNQLGAATAVNATGGSQITVGAAPLSRTLTSTTGSDLGNSSNNGSATITIPGLVSSITITFTTIGSNPVVWLSDINACVPGSFPTNWHQGANNRPFVGPTQNMPDYFLVTPDNTTTYMLDPATGVARSLFSDASKPYVNSFGYDPYNLFLYYVSEGTSGTDYNNKAVKRYDYSTEPATITTIISDITAAPFNIPTFGSGVETAGCSFYNGALYFGIEGGTWGSGSSTVTRESIIYRIEFDASNNPIAAVQVYATEAGVNGASTSVHDWGDFIIRDGIIYDFNTARASCGGSCYNYAQSKYQHYNMMTGDEFSVYTNPGTANYTGQAGMTWAGDLYYFRPSTGSNSIVGLYNEDGTNGASKTITVAGTPAWPGGSGDASDPFRPKCDFGDAPASYDPYSDPATQSPAVHERADTMWLGNTTVEATSWSKEFYKRGVTSADDNFDNGVSTVPFLKPGFSDYLVQVSMYNNSSGPATAIAWLDFNGNGTFEPSEGAQVWPSGASIPPGGSVVTRYFYWPGMTVPMSAGAYTYLRIRITSTAAGMTTAHPTGYFTKGEVEDYRVPVDNFPLAARLMNFNAGLENKKVKLTWDASDEAGVYSYEIERSADNTHWSSIGSVPAKPASASNAYEYYDINPLKGSSYYRLRIAENGTMSRYSQIRPINFNEFVVNMNVAPNPAKDKASVTVTINEPHDATLELVNMQGKKVYTKTQRMNSGPNTIELPLTDVAGGMYVVRIAAGTEIIYQKLIVNK